MATATAQLNVRMDPQLKAAGDAGLAEIGFSPSEAVRALWICAARRGKDAAIVKNLLDGADAPTLETAANGRTSSDAERLGWNIVPDGIAQFGITLKPHGEDWPSDEDLLIQAHEDRVRERGKI